MRRSPIVDVKGFESPIEQGNAELPEKPTSP